MTFVEWPLIFDCEGDQLVGSLSLPLQPLDVGVVVVVGGPQYRAGSHRQFVQLGRALVQKNIATLRFDYRGMGDSEGNARTFETIDADIRCAIDELLRLVPSVRRVVLWGLCDGASAALMALSSLRSVVGVIALNPWVRSATSLDAALVRHYYLRRIASWDFWRKLLTGQLGIVSSVTEFAQHAASAFIGTSARHLAGKPLRYQDRMSDGLAEFTGSTLLILSGRDLTAKEFSAFAASDPRWNAMLAKNLRISTERLAEADHTFSNQAWRAAVERLSCDFVLGLCTREAMSVQEMRHET